MNNNNLNTQLTNVIFRQGQASEIESRDGSTITVPGESDSALGHANLVNQAGQAVLIELRHLLFRLNYNGRISDNSALIFHGMVLSGSFNQLPQIPLVERSQIAAGLLGNECLKNIQSPVWPEFAFLKNFYLNPVEVFTPALSQGTFPDSFRFIHTVRNDIRFALKKGISIKELLGPGYYEVMKDRLKEEINFIGSQKVFNLNEALQKGMLAQLFKQTIRSATAYQAIKNRSYKINNQRVFNFLTPEAMTCSEMKSILAICGNRLRLRQGAPTAVSVKNKHFIAYKTDDVLSLYNWTKDSKDIVGQGTSCIVYKIIEMATAAERIIKLPRIKPTLQEYENSIQALAAECIFLTNVAQSGGHPNIQEAPLLTIQQADIPYFASINTKYDGNLLHFVERKLRNTVDDEKLREQFAGIADVLVQLKNHQFFHGDITPSNICYTLVNDTLKLRLIDFSNSGTYAALMNHQQNSYTNHFHIANDLLVLKDACARNDHETAFRIIEAREVYALAATIRFVILRGKTNGTLPAYWERILNHASQTDWKMRLTLDQFYYKMKEKVW